MATPRTLAQNVYFKALRNNIKPIVVATGPAGCGKTLIACNVAAERLHAQKVERVVVTRPTVTVDEDLGYLPGKLEDKMDPYMRPIMDIMSNYFTRTRIQQMMKNGTLEIAPLAFMRGRTFDKSFIIGDEMQNATQSQMKMILTRLGRTPRWQSRVTSIRRIFHQNPPVGCSTSSLQSTMPPASTISSTLP